MRKLALIALASCSASNQHQVVDLAQGACITAHILGKDKEVRYVEEICNAIETTTREIRYSNPIDGGTATADPLDASPDGG